MTEKDKFSLAERSESSKEISYSIYHSIFNKDGGSLNTPIGRIEIKDRQSGDGFNAHREIRILMRNNIEMKWGILKIIKSPRKLNKTEKIIPKSDLNKIVTELIKIEKITEPYSIYHCVENVENFETYGEFYNWE
tara:strand:- start:961 stop:1365 length:405 start_codon:yes stop_codon:yes gene_type:complete